MSGIIDRKVVHFMIFVGQAQLRLLIPATLISMSLAGTASLRRCLEGA